VSARADREAGPAHDPLRRALDRAAGLREIPGNDAILERRHLGE